METEIVKTSQIRIDVSLDKENNPVQMQWDADDSDIEGKQEAKSMILAIWDGFHQNAMRIDLWTQKMNVEEMNVFMFQTFSTLGDTFERATNNKEVADDMRNFAHQLGHKLDIFGDEHKH